MLQHLLLHGGNGYVWSPDGQIRSVFAHLPPDSTLAERQARPGGEAGRPAELRGVIEDWERRDLEERTRVRATSRQRARTHGRVTISAGSRTLDDWGLLARRPRRVHPAWQVLLEEAERVFAAAWAEQDAAEAGLRRQWNRNPAARTAQLLTGELGRAWAADQITDAELAACDRLLAAWRHRAWPARIDRPRLTGQRDRNRAQRDLVRQILDELDAGEQATAGRAARTRRRPASRGPPRPSCGRWPPASSPSCIPTSGLSPIPAGSNGNGPATCCGKEHPPPPPSPAARPRRTSPSNHDEG